MAEYRKIDWKVYREGNQLYIRDNVVRKPRFEADPEIEFDHRRQVEINRDRRRKKEYARQMNRRQICFHIVCAVIVFAAVALNLSMISRTEAAKKEIKKLNTQVVDLKSTNDEIESNMNANINVEEIRRAAIEELGMVYVNQNQVVMYDCEESEYVRQYEAIPASQ